MPPADRLGGDSGAADDEVRSADALIVRTASTSRARSTRVRRVGTAGDNVVKYMTLSAACQI